MFARKFLNIYATYENTSKDFILDNLERIMGYSDALIGRKNTDRAARIATATDSTRNLVSSWFNRGRQDAKIPFYKLCQICDCIGVDITDILTKKYKPKRDFSDSEYGWIFEKIDEVGRFENGEWDLEGIATDAAEIIGGWDAQQVYDIMCIYFRTIFGIDGKKFYFENEIRDSVWKNGRE